MHYVTRMFTRDMSFYIIEQEKTRKHRRSAYILLLFKSKMFLIEYEYILLPDLRKDVTDFTGLSMNLQHAFNIFTGDVDQSNGQLQVKQMMAQYEQKVGEWVETHIYMLMQYLNEIKNPYAQAPCT